VKAQLMKTLQEPQDDLVPTVPRLLLNVDEVAVALRIGTVAAWKLVMSGAIPSCKIGRSRRVKTADLERFVAELPRAS
jgi:excisionase family DNA binding protein